MVLKWVIKKFSKLHTHEEIPNVEEETTESLEQRFERIEDINNDES